MFLMEFYFRSLPVSSVLSIMRGSRGGGARGPDPPPPEKSQEYRVSVVMGDTLGHFLSLKRT